MSLALEQARLAGSLGEVPAGAVVAGPAGEALALGRNQVIGLSDPTAHAEIQALRAAAGALGNYRLTGLTLVSTLEPCPMCLMAAVHARLALVLFGAPEPKWGAAGSILDLCALPGLNHRLEIRGGLLAEECAALMRDFFRPRRQKGPPSPQPSPAIPGLAIEGTLPK
ncbi:MAG: nucleoside deaminase [Deltaproteobacteria bacterium]|jgi:tRNA(adenine34) deaminase|nr:nucleoside deaminase [Deltaproteobacteria bacterium]